MDEIWTSRRTVARAGDRLTGSRDCGKSLRLLFDAELLFSVAVRIARALVPLPTVWVVDGAMGEGQPSAQTGKGGAQGIPASNLADDQTDVHKQMVRKPHTV